MTRGTITYDVRVDEEMDCVVFHAVLEIPSLGKRGIWQIADYVPHQEMDMVETDEASEIFEERLRRPFWEFRRRIVNDILWRYNAQRKKAQ